MWCLSYNTITSHFSNFIMPLMEDDQAMLSNNNANANTNYSIINSNNNNNYLTTILKKLTTNDVHSLILDPLGNNFLLHLLQSSHQTFINHLLLSLITSSQHFLPPCLHHLGLVSIYIYIYIYLSISINIYSHFLLLN